MMSAGLLKGYRVNALTRVQQQICGCPIRSGALPAVFFALGRRFSVLTMKIYRINHDGMTMDW